MTSSEQVIASLVKDVPAEPDMPSEDGPRALDQINEVALEWALRQRSAGNAHSVVSIAMGPPEAAESLRRTLAFGADEVLLMSDPALAGADIRQTARALAAAIAHVGATIAVLGYESSDSSSGVVPSAVAAVLGWPVLSRVGEAAWNADGTLDVDRDAGHGRQSLRVRPPVILSFVEGRIEPRYPALRDVLRARTARIGEIDHAQLCPLGSDSPHNERVVRTEMVEPPIREPQFIGAVDGPGAILDVLAEAGAR
jgi:electron transfer flavoprotein beta subunit